MLNKYVLIRTNFAGVHFGILAEKNGTEVLLKNATRIWYWSGAASLSQLAMEGVKNPENCKFSVEVEEIILTGVIEIILISEVALINLKNVPLWKS